MAIAYLPNLSGVKTDQVFGIILREIQLFSIFGYAVSILILSAILAAMMSTADSALLSISSIFTKDIYSKYQKNYNEEKLTKVGKICSWIVLFLLVILAIKLKNNFSLVALMDRKMDLLIQLAPAFMLGLHYKEIKPTPIIIGIIIGVIISLTLAFGNLSFTNNGKLYGFHPGLIGIIPNILIVLIGSYKNKIFS
tara:strand:- start:1096 stop:1680 length:585 start_codon:yes stop_codon:yes gene_type:complete